jgi:hypothetical protein
MASAYVRGRFEIQARNSRINGLTVSGIATLFFEASAENRFELH